MSKPQTTKWRGDRKAARDALQCVLDDPRPWHEVAKGWTRDQFVTRLSELDMEIAGSHYCPDWDGLLIHSSDPEMECSQRGFTAPAT